MRQFLLEVRTFFAENPEQWGESGRRTGGVGEGLRPLSLFVFVVTFADFFRAGGGLWLKTIQNKIITVIRSGPLSLP